jgi:hypothetical protein
MPQLKIQISNLRANAQFQISNLRANAQSLLWTEYYNCPWSVTLWCGASRRDCKIKSPYVAHPPDALRYASAP